MKEKFTKEFLISEIHRFYNEYNRTPYFSEFTRKNGYPDASNVSRKFGTWNNAIEEADLKVTQYRDMNPSPDKKCKKCGELLNNSKSVCYINKEPFCRNCWYVLKRDYMNGKLEPSSTTGKGLISELIVCEVMKLDKKDNLNITKNFHSPHDLYDKNKYGKIDVKSCALFYSKNRKHASWGFNLNKKYIPDTYVCLGFSMDRKNIEHVWIIPAKTTWLYNKSTIAISNTYKNLNKRQKYEVSIKPYNKIYHSMSLDTCSYMNKHNDKSDIKCKIDNNKIIFENKQMTFEQWEKTI